MKLRYLDYRYAEAVLDHPTFRESKQEIIEILSSAKPPLLSPDEPDPKKGGVKRRGRSQVGGVPRYLYLPVDQKSLNLNLDEQFRLRNWQLQPAIVPKDKSGPVTGLKGDYRKGALQVEAQFGNMARWYTDVFKFQLSYSLGEIDVAVLIVPVQAFASMIDENVANFERVARELPWAKMSLTLPIWVIGIEPDDWTAVRDCYEKAAQNFEQARLEAGQQVGRVPFDTRLVETPSDEEPPVGS
jgi:hypothetical protein